MKKQLKCEEIRIEMSIVRTDEQISSEISEHIQRCPDCDSEAKLTRKALTFLQKLPQDDIFPDEKLWMAIEKGISQTNQEAIEENRVIGIRGELIFQYSYLILIGTMIWLITSTPQPLMTDFVGNFLLFSNPESIQDYIPFLFYLLLGALFSAVSAPILLNPYSVEIKGKSLLEKFISGRFGISVFVGIQSILPNSAIFSNLLGHTKI
ncbi:MAG: hypothetical protein HQM08_11195 [Candidatus Riflebacteria bacterium]|nr:hypothetical protein [Candidatus Riflebacteria bacterium]